MRLSVSDARVERTSDGHAFLFEARYGYAYLLNDPAADMVEELIQNDPSEDDLVRLLTERFELDPNDDPRRDVRLFLERLRAYGLLP